MIAQHSFFNLFFEEEPFVAIMAAQGTHRHRQEFLLEALVRPEGSKFEAKGRKWGFGEGRLEGLGSGVSSPVGFGAFWTP